MQHGEAVREVLPTLRRWCSGIGLADKLAPLLLHQRRLSRVEVVQEEGQHGHGFCGLRGGHRQLAKRLLKRRLLAARSGCGATSCIKASRRPRGGARARPAPHLPAGPVRLVAGAAVSVDNELRVVPVLPAVGHLQLGKHPVRDLEGAGSSEKLFRLKLPHAHKLLQERQHLARVVGQQLLLNVAEQGKAHLNHDLPARNEEPVPHTSYDRLCQVAGKEGQEPLHGVVLGCDAVPLQCRVHPGQKTLDDLVELPDRYAKLGESWPVEVGQSMPEQQRLRTVEN
mmetsp:Transcript_88647/g.251276  ORF Transcript_88647/g.251276 Transcript_88647/m.251276 type:complete len:283 (-) Transcript_88647:607-1455(-)